jgi:hypothetical protein
MGQRATDAVIEWAFDTSAFPGGLHVQLEMPAWTLEREHFFPWSEVSNAHLLVSSLLGLWDDILKERINTVLAESGLGGGQ